MQGAPPSFRLDGQVALVTASSKGIGRACALALAHAGADIVLGLHDRATGEDLAREIEALGRRALPVQMDVTRLDEVRGAVQEALAHFGQIDLLVNNAGIGAPNPAEDVTEEDFDATVAVNLRGTFFVAQVVGRHMLERGRGVIVNISSQAGFVALPTESVYCMTKAGVSHLTRCLALEWAPRGVRVNAVAPTFVETPGTRRWLDDPAFRASVVERIPLGRVGQPVDVAGAVVFLASPAAALITGETLMIDGGWTIR
ncbi:oxidoreductase (plasmid) [Deinococcus aetherius]|uniref:Oxidoreductase n=1 Tax=Deinococcus aetherius TaxID=200252 RepID=A0ABM8AKJ1_9DEIO|nr:glucose 1-dehydrogenase [Deinococcus aetherius]BDP44343.1 oxidoreductase [Deinococcus aetherius]